ncbi:class I adenylate-forming enzyme family protein [Roseiarcus sp.]|uniref:class I adenylate-forming enzyme family protein n=1 Tax=Roseiarcus sp. TaxID=1969460 RepID=UPI003F9BD5AE
MDSWFDRGDVPETRYELHYGDRLVRCFADRPKGVHAMLENAVERRPHGTALICDDERLTYLDLEDRVSRVAGGLRALGVGKGDRVALVLGNSIEFVVVLFAVARLGAVSVPLNTRHQLAENRHIIEDCSAKVVVHERDLADRIPAPGTPPSLKHMVSIRRDDGAPLAGLIGARPVTRPEAVEEEETATILYTSGTTGRPKGAMLTHFSIAHSVLHYNFAMGLTEDDRGLLAVPMSHVTGLIALVDAMIHCAGALVIMPSFKASAFIDLAARHRVTYSLIVPAMFNLCLLAPNFGEADLSAWRISGYGGAIMPEATLERIAEKLPKLKLLNCYGSTETTSPAAMMPPEQTVARKDSVGLAVPCGHILVMDAGGVEAPYGEPGEIYIGGAMVVPGYFNNPEATESEFKGGYWKSGDLGIMDAQGYLRVVDRIKDVINRGGYKIFASEVENVLLEHPAIVEVAVVAKPCPVLGERVHAFVVLRDTVPDDELQRHCADLLTDYKVPEAFHRIDSTLPRNANGKVLKRDLRRILVA